MPSDSSRRVEPSSACSALVIEFGARVVQRRLLLVQRRDLRVELRLLLVERRELLGSGAGRLGLCPRRVELRLRRVELRRAGVELRLPGVELGPPVLDLRLRVGELLGAVRLLLLGVERVDHRRDVVEVLGAGRGIRDRLLLLVGERRAVVGLIDDGCRHAGAVRKLLGELVDDRTRCGAGNVEAVAERPAEGEEGADREAEDEHPADDHAPRPASGERTQTVEQCGHGVSSSRPFDDTRRLV